MTPVYYLQFCTCELLCLRLTVVSIVSTVVLVTEHRQVAKSAAHLHAVKIIPTPPTLGATRAPAVSASNSQCGNGARQVLKFGSQAAGGCRLQQLLNAIQLHSMPDMLLDATTENKCISYQACSLTVQCRGQRKGTPACLSHAKSLVGRVNHQLSRLTA
jgi:hypothetical protein